MLNRRQAVRLIAVTPAIASGFQADLPKTIARPWIGPEYWANPLQDWRLAGGRIECHVAGGERNVYLLTHEATPADGTLSLKVTFGHLGTPAARERKEGFVGFRLGIRGLFNDYRDSAIWGWGLNAGVAADGTLFIGTVQDAAPKATATLDNLTLTLTAQPTGTTYTVALKLTDAAGAVVSEYSRGDVPSDQLTGGIALVCHSGVIGNSPDPSTIVQNPGGLVRRNSERGGNMRFWFKDWSVAGTKLKAYPDRAVGPILWAMHTLSRQTMKMTVQFAPIESGVGPVKLEIMKGNRWQSIGTSAIDPASRTAHFRATDWDDKADLPYRVTVETPTTGSSPNVIQEFTGTIRKDPVDKTKLTVCGISCINDLGFPHAPAVNGIAHFRPDFIAFTGDQIYERSAGYGTQRQPLEPATLDYLRKWYLLGWSFRDLLRDTPCVTIPDDHDVYHGNIWGSGGRKAEGMGQPGQDSGGYTQPAAWVNIVQKTQTAHLPDAFDPTPIDQNISVYYTSMLYGGVSFAILEDRKWKSAPKNVLPKANIVNGWAQSTAYSAPRDGDAPGAQLLGERQEKFLEEWSRDWEGAYFKCAISQTIFANLATLPKPANTDSVTPKLPVLPVGGYGEGEVPVADHDSNGWPQTPRRRAIESLRRCFAVHIAGDQHLGSTIQYGLDEWNDAPWAICVPAISNLFPRRWYPPTEGANRKPGQPRNMGEFTDGFGNKVTVHAVFNPQAYPHEPRLVTQRAPGYGIIEFDRTTRKITVANWPSWVDPSRPGAQPAAGWPITIDMLDNGYPKKAKLESIKIGASDAVVEVIDESDGKPLYSIRVSGPEFTPFVPGRGPYTVRVLGPKKKLLQERKGLKPS